MNQPECSGNSEERCKQIINYEGKCKWTDCNTTPAPTPSPINPVTPSPTKSPITVEGCYSNNYKDCLPDGYTSLDCNMVWLPDGAQANCIALWEECTGNLSSCCGPAICFGDDSYASCVPPMVTSAPTKSCRVKGE